VANASILKAAHAGFRPPSGHRLPSLKVFPVLFGSSPRLSGWYKNRQRPLPLQSLKFHKTSLLFDRIRSKKAFATGTVSTYDSHVLLALKTLCQYIFFRFRVCFPSSFSLNPTQQPEHVSKTLTFCDANSPHNATQDSRQPTKKIFACT
jgi:hypothetical protein